MKEREEEAGGRSWSKGKREYKLVTIKPLNMAVGVEEIRSLGSVPEIGGAPWSGMETIMKANFSIWSQMFKPPTCMERR